MPLPGREDDLLFQKKTSDMPNQIGEMILVHEDGTTLYFRGFSIGDEKRYKSRFAYEYNNENPVVIFFDNKNGHWGCSCGGSTIPFHTCKHLKTLDIVVGELNSVIIMTEDEYKAATTLVSPFCSKCGKKLPLNSGHCPCGRTNALYESELQKQGKSVGLNYDQFIWEKEPKTFTFKCPDCNKIFTSDNSYAACPSCPMAEIQFEEYNGPVQQVYYDQKLVNLTDIFTDIPSQVPTYEVSPNIVPEDTGKITKKSKPVHTCLECRYQSNDESNFVSIYDSSKASDGKLFTFESQLCRSCYSVMIKMGRFRESPQTKENPDIPNMGKKRIFADRDEEV